MFTAVHALLAQGMLTGDTFVEWSLLIRAIIFAVLFILLGYAALNHKSENKPKYINPLGWLSIFAGGFNVLMAIEWTYIFFLV